MRFRITIAMLEIRNRITLQSKVNICKSDVKIGDYADSLHRPPHTWSSIFRLQRSVYAVNELTHNSIIVFDSTPNSIISPRHNRICGS